MSDGDFSKTRRRLPHWRLDGATYFITFRLLAQPLLPDEITLVRDHIVGGDGRFYDLLCVMAMPDHKFTEEMDFYGMKNPALVYLNFCLVHMVHHRGQLSAYLRPAGGKVPAIYGSSADEAFQM